MKMTGVELVKFCRSKLGTAYVYGMKGKTMTQANYDTLKNMARRSGTATAQRSGRFAWTAPG